MKAVAEYWTDRRKDLLRDERGVIYKVDVAATIALCFPNSYFVGMSNLGFHTAYWHFNLPENVKAERAFYEGDEKPLTLESGRSLDEFSLVGFSINFELDYVNILRMLSLSKIPLLREKRNYSHPLVFIGGIVTFFNIRPLIPFIDFAFIGESEELFEQVNNELVHYAATKGVEKTELLKRLSLIDGIFVPGFSQTVNPRYVDNLDHFECVSRIITPHTEFKNMFLVEISRGCLHKCNFCVSGHVYQRPRFRTLSHIMRSCERGLLLTNRLGFIASAPSDYPSFDELCAYLKSRNAKVSFSSLRVSSITKSVLELLIASGQTSLTLAPETGSERLRKHISKNIDNKCFFDVIQLAKKCGMKRIKLYMLIGLPDETDADLDETVLFIKESAKIMLIRVSVTPFIPKPATPFERYTINDKKIIRKKIAFLRHAFKNDTRVTLTFDGIKAAHQQASLAKGDETILLDEAEKLSSL